MFTQFEKLDREILRDLEAVVRKHARPETVWDVAEFVCASPKRVRQYLEMGDAQTKRLANVEKQIDERRELEYLFREPLHIQRTDKDDERAFSLSAHPKYKTKAILRFKNGSSLVTHKKIYIDGIVAVDPRSFSVFHMHTGAKLKLDQYSFVIGHFDDVVVFERRFNSHSKIHLWEGKGDCDVRFMDSVIEVPMGSSLITTADLKEWYVEEAAVSARRVKIQGQKVIVNDETFWLLGVPMFANILVYRMKDRVLENNVYGTWDLAHFDRIRVFQVLCLWLSNEDLLNMIFSYL
jgi:hypothetical protein